MKSYEEKIALVRTLKDDLNRNVYTVVVGTHGEIRDFYIMFFSSMGVVGRVDLHIMEEVWEIFNK